MSIAEKQCHIVTYNKSVFGHLFIFGKVPYGHKLSIINLVNMRLPLCAFYLESMQLVYRKVFVKKKVYRKVELSD